MTRLWKLFLIALTAAVLPVCAVAASSADSLESEDYLSFSQEDMASGSDPLEGFNRSVHSFNAVVDTILFNPAAEVYNTVLPEFARTGVYNFLNNIEAPVVFVNSILQGDPENVFVTFWRFVFNTTLGIGGLFDIASELGMPERHHEDFGQTLGVWGVGQIAYLEVPIIGPSSLRDLPGKIVDILINPFTYALTTPQSIGVAATDALDTRARLDNYIDQVNTSSLDPYATFRSLYLQHRVAMVNNTTEAKQ